MDFKSEMREELDKYFYDGNSILIEKALSSLLALIENRLPKDIERVNWWSIGYQDCLSEIKSQFK